MEIKEILYNEIDKIGKNNIRIEISKDIKNTIFVIDKIIEGCLPKIKNLQSKQDDLVSFSEALMHFLLTISLIPSERKIIFNDTNISIVIPNSRLLKNEPHNVLIIEFYKDYTMNMDDFYSLLSKIQPHRENVWIISSNPVKSNFTNFVVNPNESQLKDNIVNFDQIINRISDFLIRINYGGLRIL